MLSRLNAYNTPGHTHTGPHTHPATHTHTHTHTHTNGKLGPPRQYCWLFFQSVPDNLHANRLHINIDYRSNDEKDNYGGGGGGGEKEERDDNFKIRAKTRQQNFFLNGDDDEKYGSDTRDEQGSIQMIVSHRDTHKNTAQISNVIISNGSKNSKCRPKSDQTHNK